MSSSQPSPTTDPLVDYTLFYAPCTAALSVHWFLVELESLSVRHDLRLVDFSSKQQKSEEYLALNPKGRVPTLAIRRSGQTLAESTAILLYLAERHPGFAPLPEDSGYAFYLESVIYIANTLLPALRDWVYADKDGDAEYALGVRKLAKKRILDSFALWDQQLAERLYLAGGNVTMVDFLAASLCAWTLWLEEQVGNYPHVQRWLSSMRERTSWEEVKRREGKWTYGDTSRWQWAV